eukprot:c24976_g2_i1 orf=645-1025(+)
MFNKFIGKRNSRKPSKGDGNGTTTTSTITTLSGTGGRGIAARSTRNLGPSSGGRSAGNYVPRSTVSHPVQKTNNCSSPRFVPGKDKFQPIPHVNGGAASFFVEPLPSLRDVPSSERQSLFIKKLNL